MKKGSIHSIRYVHCRRIVFRFVKVYVTNMCTLVDVALPGYILLKVVNPIRNNRLLHVHLRKGVTLHCCTLAYHHIYTCVVLVCIFCLLRTRRVCA